MDIKKRPKRNHMKTAKKKKKKNVGKIEID